MRRVHTGGNTAKMINGEVIMKRLDLSKSPSMSPVASPISTEKPVAVLVDSASPSPA
jgi:hypothetical protein